MRILILEDNPIRIEKFKQLFKNQELFISDNVKEALNICLIQNFQVMFLDHDLGDAIWVDSNEENTGYQFVKKIIENQLQKNALIYIHSSNPIGANKMLNFLLDNRYDGIWHPYHLWKI
jgi:CheY-like chemotaxis protein